MEDCCCSGIGSSLVGSGAHERRAAGSSDAFYIGATKLAEGGFDALFGAIADRTGNGLDVGRRAVVCGFLHVAADGAGSQ